MIVVLAAFLAGRRDRIGRLSTILIASVLMAIPTFLVFRQPDLGTALVFVGILIGMLFMSGASLGWMGLFAAASSAGRTAGGQHAARLPAQRLFCFLDPYADAQGACYQLVQALNAVGSGGWLGRGLTVGRRGPTRLHPRPVDRLHLHRGGRGLGFVGGVVVLALFGLLVWRILLIGWQAGTRSG